VLQVAREGKGKGPIVVTGVSAPSPTYLKLVEDVGGKFITVPVNENGRLQWPDILAVLFEEGIRSIMIEGGACVINSLLDRAHQSLIDSVIVTIAPTWLGQGGVVVSPPRVHDQGGVAVPAARLSDVAWHPLGEDVVLCGRLE
jgi:2,5-diamino-6-(ribosylamino)-4(3H)-pyrimidinone 5'-phosphate reductase